jgi:hypothetical protein
MLIIVLIFIPLGYKFTTWNLQGIKRMSDIEYCKYIRLIHLLALTVHSSQRSRNVSLLSPAYNTQTFTSVFPIHLHGLVLMH